MMVTVATTPWPRVFGFAFVQAPVADQPAEGALYYPPAGQHDEPGDVVGAFDDGHGQAQNLVGPDDQASGVAAVGPDQADRGEPLAQQRQQPVCAVAVLHAGGGDGHHQQQSEAVGGDVSLAPLARVLTGTGRGHGIGATHGLGVDDRCGRQLGAAGLGKGLSAAAPAGMIH
jgi:hypothetical protein